METRSDRGVILLIHGLWFHPNVWTPWLEELDEAGYDAVVLSWSSGERPPDNRPIAVEPDFNALVRVSRTYVKALGSRPIVIGHGAGGAVAERLLNDGDAAAAISLAPVPGGYPAVPAAVRLLTRWTSLALLGLRGNVVVPSFSQFRRAIANVSDDPAARDFYAKYAAAGKPRDVLRHAARRRLPAGSRRKAAPRRGPLLLVAGGKDELVREMSVASLHRDYRRRQPDAVTDYKVFPDLDHTLSLGTPGVALLFYCLDWLTAQNM